jgi:hypothetical protein
MYGDVWCSFEKHYREWLRRGPMEWFVDFGRGGGWWWYKAEQIALEEIIGKQGPISHRLSAVIFLKSRTHMERRDARKCGHSNVLTMNSANKCFTQASSNLTD